MTEPAEHERAAAVPTSQHAIIEVTQAGIVTSWNPGAGLLYGYTEEEMVGQSAEVLRPAGRQAEQVAVVRRVIEAGRTERYEADLVRSDGTGVVVSLTVTPIVGPDGAVVGVREVSWEVTGQRAAQDQAEMTIDSERRNARHVQAQTDAQRRGARDAQDQIDAQADAQRRGAQDAQDQIDAQAGVQRRGAQDAQDQIDAQAGVQRRDARDAQDQAEAAQDSKRRDAQDLFDARRADERREALEQTEGLHAQVRQIQRMDSLGQLAGGVAHDFNNLLAIILSYAAFVSHRLTAAAEGGGDEGWDEARADIAHIQQAVERAAALTRQLLAFASREAIRPLALDLNEVIAGVEELLRRAIGEHIELSTSLAEGLWPILADAGKFEQVLINLAVNARDAMPRGGTLSIATGNITVAADSAGVDPQAYQERRVQLQVSDTGTGMTADVLERAFEPFFTTKEAGRGTGLGLATVYGILTQAGADMQISSRPGMGTTFTIVLPVTDVAAAPAEKPLAFEWEPHGETILVVEDEDELREVTTRILANAGYHVVAAAKGPKAIEIARNHDGQIHLVVTDIVMPHMLGTEVAERIRVIRPDARVLYMSGYAWLGLASQCRLDPDAVLLEKPFSDADLLAKTRQALGGPIPRARDQQGKPAPATQPVQKLAHPHAGLPDGGCELLPACPGENLDVIRVGAALIVVAQTAAVSSPPTAETRAIAAAAIARLGIS